MEGSERGLASFDLQVNSFSNPIHDHMGAFAHFQDHHHPHQTQFLRFLPPTLSLPQLSQPPLHTTTTTSSTTAAANFDSEAHMVHRDSWHKEQVELINLIILRVFDCFKLLDISFFFLDHKKRILLKTS